MHRRIAIVSCLTALTALALLTGAAPSPAGAARPIISVTAIDKTASEDPVMADCAVFRMIRAGNVRSNVRVTYAVSGTATAGTDYAALLGTLIIPSGKRYFDITVRPAEDHTLEGEETITLTLNRRPNYVRGASRRATVVIADETTDTYKVARLRAADPPQYRLYYQRNAIDHHFLTVIDNGRVCVLRPHPGVDPNGWGTSVYLQPFLPGATLGHTTMDAVVAQADAIIVSAHGLVSRGATGTFGTWNAQLSFTYDDAAKRVTGVGRYVISLRGNLSEATGDLNVLKIASNYLRGVPLLDGTIGDTGDMEYATTVSSRGVQTWIPWQQPAHFPMDAADSFDITLVGDYNNVDTARQGHKAIAEAYKPTVQLVLQSTTPDIAMITGYQFDTSKATDFAADNVGVTPLVLKSSTWKRFSFDIRFESTALAGDGDR